MVKKSLWVNFFERSLKASLFCKQFFVIEIRFILYYVLQPNVSKS